MGAYRTAAEVFREERLKVYVVAALGSAIWFGVLGALMAGLKDMNTFMAFKGVVVSYLLGMFFFVVMVMLVFSSGIISYGALFDAGEVGYLFGRGVTPANVYTYRLTHAVVFSAWATAVMGLPVIIAYGADSGAAWWYYPLATLTAVLLLLVASGTGGLVALVAGRYIARYERAVVAVLVLVLAVGGLYVAMSLPAYSGDERAYTEEWMFRILGWFTFTRRLYYPSAWASRAVEALVAGDAAGWAPMTYGLAATALLIWQAGRVLAGLLYRRAFEEAWQLSVRRKSRWNPLIWALARGLSPASRRLSAVIYKDVALFARDPLQWGQSAIFLGLVLLYFIGVRRFAGVETGEVWYVARLDLSFLSVIMTLATFTTRFGFPQVSMELRSPLVLTSGIPRKWLLRAKALWTAMLSAAVAAGLLAFGGRCLRLDAAATLLTVSAGAGAAAGLACLAVALGAVFPERSRRSPSEMVSSFGGTVTLVLSLVMVGVYVAGYHAAVVPLVRQQALRPWAIPVLVAAGPVVGMVFLRAGERSLARLEWT